MNAIRNATLLAGMGLMSLFTSTQAQTQKKLGAAVGTQIPLIRTLSIHNPTPAYLLEADEKANDAIVQGHILLKSGHITDAIAEFQSALKYVPNDGGAYQGLAEAYTAAGRLNEASQALRRVLVEGSGLGVSSGIGGSADIWAEYALVLVKTHQPAEAVQMYNHAAFMLDYQDSKDNGGKPFLRVLFPEIVMGDALPNQVPYTLEHLQALADSLLAYQKEGFWSDKEVLAHAEEAVKLYPNSPVTYYYQGEVLLTRDHAGAKAAYQKAAELGDDNTNDAVKERLKMVR